MVACVTELLLERVFLGRGGAARIARESATSNNTRLSTEICATYRGVTVAGRRVILVREWRLGRLRSPPDGASKLTCSTGAYFQTVLVSGNTRYVASCEKDRVGLVLDTYTAGQYDGGAQCVV